MSQFIIHFSDNTAPVVMNTMPQVIRYLNTVGSTKSTATIYEKTAVAVRSGWTINKPAKSNSRKCTKSTNRENKSWSQEEIRRISSLFKSGMSAGQIALEVGRTGPAVYGQLSKNGIFRKNYPSA